MSSNLQFNFGWWKDNSSWHLGEVEHNNKIKNTSYIIYEGVFMHQTITDRDFISLKFPVRTWSHHSTLPQISSPWRLSSEISAHQISPGLLKSKARFPPYLTVYDQSEHILLANNSSTPSTTLQDFWFGLYALKVFITRSWEYNTSSTTHSFTQRLEISI